jgi:triosephosphate isomerase
MRKQIAAANWKMNLSYQQAEKLIDDLLAFPRQLNEHQEAIFAVPFPYLSMVANKLAGKQNIYVAAQNCSNKKCGAYTGETSLEILQSIGVNHVVIGHSERREYFNESNQLLAEKVDICIANNATPIFCCGEPLSVREANEQDSFVAKQLKESLYHLSAVDVQKVIVAYEPIWAIGTGKTATSQQAQDIQAFIRQQLAAQYDEVTANNMVVV